MVFKIKGILEFSPTDYTKKHVNQASWKSVAIIKTDCDIDQYYAWFLKKRFNLELNKNLRGTHVTFINDRMDKNTFDSISALFNNKEITIYVEIEPKSNGKHWWLRVHSPEAESIRELMGLTREPFFGMHLTIGHAVVKYPESVEFSDTSAMKIKKDYIEHSEYILECCKKFNLTSNEPRKPLNDLIEIKFGK